MQYIVKEKKNSS